MVDHYKIEILDSELNYMICSSYEEALLWAKGSEREEAFCYYKIIEVQEDSTERVLITTIKV